MRKKHVLMDVVEVVVVVVGEREAGGGIVV
jgi:hypothetical protein